MAGRGTPATALLTRLGIKHAVHVYEHDPHRASYGLEIELAPGDLVRAAGAVVADIRHP